MCSTCLELQEDMLSAANCGHVFCRECWQAHLETQINQGKVVGECVFGRGRAVGGVHGEVTPVVLTLDPPQVFPV